MRKLIALVSLAVFMPSLALSQHNGVDVDLSVLDSFQEQKHIATRERVLDEGLQHESVKELRAKYFPESVDADEGSTMLIDKMPQSILESVPSPIKKPKQRSVSRASMSIPAPELKPSFTAPEVINLSEVKPVEKKLQAELGIVKPASVTAEEIIVIAPPEDTLDSLPEESSTSEVINITANLGSNNNEAPEAKDIKGLRITAIGYGDDDIRLDDDVKTSLTQQFIPQIKAHSSSRLGLYSYASSENRGSSKANRLSLSRALELRSFLITGGIDPRSIDIFPLGDTAPDGFRDRVDLIIQK